MSEMSDRGTVAPRTEEGEAAKAMTNFQSNPKGKRSIAIPSKDLKRISQLFFWFGGDFAKPSGVRPFYRNNFHRLYFD